MLTVVDEGKERNINRVLNVARLLTSAECFGVDAQKFSNFNVCLHCLPCFIVNQMQQSQQLQYSFI